MRENTPSIYFTQILRNAAPAAIAWIKGNSDNPQLSGSVKFYKTPYQGILIEAEIFGLPNISKPGSSNYYAMHIHSNGDCSKAFTQTGEHFSKRELPHPEHSGDLLPLIGNQGYAWSAFYDKRINIEDIENRSVVIHARPDDFTTQPSGNAGEKIGCGIIRLK